MKLPFVIAIQDSTGAYNEVVGRMVKDNVTFYRNVVDYESMMYGITRAQVSMEYIGFYHDKYMDTYYDRG